MRGICNLFALLSAAAHLTSAIDLDISDPSSIRSTAATIAYGMIKYYTGNITNTPETVGVLPGPYYWWESGAMWGAMLDYYHYTGDDTYNNITTQALISQIGPLEDFMVPRHQKDEGNDDQAFWLFTAMSAAEMNHPQPTMEQSNYTWLQLTENGWNTQVRRWDTASCNGGLKWQIFSFNNGYDYKNSVSNGAFFQLSARLARFTGNQTYIDWAIKSYNWSRDIGLITDDYTVYDGTSDLQNCTTQDMVVWTYNAAIYMYGSAVLYNYTNGSTLWQQRTEGFLNNSARFFSPYENATNIMFEPPCETVNTCNNDQFSFKGYLSRFMWASTLLAPFTQTAVSTFLNTTAVAAAQACSGGFDGVTCGEKWYVGGYDDKIGVGQQMSAMETIQGLLAYNSTPPLHSDDVSIRVTPTTSQAPVPTATATATATATPTKKSSAMSLSVTSIESLALSLLSSSSSTSMSSTIAQAITETQMPESETTVSRTKTSTFCPFSTEGTTESVSMLLESATIAPASTLSPSKSTSAPVAVTTASGAPTVFNTASTTSSTSTPLPFTGSAASACLHGTFLGIVVGLSISWTAF